MKELLTKIIRYVSKNRTVVLIISGILFVSIALIYSLLDFSDDQEQVDLIDVPLQISQEIILELSSDLYEKLDLEKRPEAQIYNAVAEDMTNQIDVFLAQIGKTNLNKKSYDDLLTLWLSDSDILQYTQGEGKIFFRFTDPVQVPETELGFINSENGADALAQVARAISGKVFTYTNIKTKSVGTGFRIEGNREVDGVRIENSGSEEYSDYLVIDDNGGIIEGSFFIIEISDISTVVDIIHPSNLASLMKIKEFPKEVNQGYPSNLTEEDFNLEEDIYDNPYGDILDEVLDFPRVEDVSASEIELVYFYHNSNYPEVIPVYRIEGFGEVTFNGDEYSVPMVIYANAIDPDLVYIPSDLDEPTPEL